MHKAFAATLLLMMLSCMLRNGKSFGLARRQSLQGVLGSRSLLRMELSSTTATKKDKKKKEENKYVKTCMLPTTTFDFRANAIKREPEIQKFWQESKVYQRLCETNPGEKFILHDGPPYANGDLHIGHALNKILKDFINKYQTLRGRKVSYVPGWDCHGLPIELKVLQNMKASERQKLSPIQLRKTAAEFAKTTMASQREGFKRYGVWGNWDQPYLTLQPGYEAAQIKVFGEMVEKGHIYRGKRPVNWSPSSRTALAEAELEYPENHVSRSVYVGFPATQLSPALHTIAGGDVNSVRVTVWTTTPWTLPANAAVAVNPEIEYCLVGHPTLPHKYLLAKELVPTFASKVGINSTTTPPLEVSATVKGSDLVGTQYRHPLYDRTSSVVLGGEYINTQSGTGLVHTAPGHGAEDYVTGLKHGLPLLSPVDDAGCFTAEAGEALVGLDVLGQGTTKVIDALRECGALLKEEAYPHKYPYDWRTKKPTICRLTEQWFASVSGFRAESMSAIDSVQWIPAVGRTRIASMVEGRADWCISRQRVWGVPIPAFYHKETRVPLMTKETIAHIESVFREKGSDAWWELSTAELLPSGPLRDQADQYEKGTDTMDVWFDSGTSWAGVVRDRSDLAQFPADMYLEGSDQSRGWFQSSLLTSVATQGVAPFKTVLTHGFVMDEKGMKMSKSIGNVVDPLQVINGGSNPAEQPAYGADTLRLWVAGCDYFHDVQIGPTIMKHVAESFRKLRNTLRFIIGGLADFNPATDLVPYDQLPSLDKHSLGRLTQVIKSIESGYESYNFLKVSSTLNYYAITDLSAFYLVQAKDRLYVSTKDDPRRRSCQTVLYHILEQLTTALAPILPHLAEDIWLNVPYPRSKDSVFEKGWIKEEFPEVEEKKWEYLSKVKEDVQACLERARAAKLVGASMEGRVVLHCSDPPMQELLKSMAGDATLQATPTATNGVDDLRFLFCTSQVDVVASEAEVLAQCPEFNMLANVSSSAVTVGVAKARGSKCERCWMYCPSVGKDSVHSDLCSRCANVMVVDKHVL